LYASTDNLPNQFIKTLLEDWRGLAQETYDSLNKQKGATKKASAPILRGLAECSRMIDSLDAVLSTSLFKAVSKLSQVPLANQVLQKRSGYRELVRIYQQAQLAGVLTWDGADSVFGAGQRDVAMLYEYWVFLQIGRIVADLCKKSFDYAGLFQLSQFGLQLNLRKNRTQVVQGWVTRGGQDFHLGLWFNRPFRRASGESWSKDMRPDLSLGIGLSENAAPLERVWIHFDAKYRVERLIEVLRQQEDFDLNDQSSFSLEGRPEERALRDDLLKMHAYRDAIRRSSGAYVIYPGETCNPRDHETYFEYHELLPGLGAFTLRPSEDGAAAGVSRIASFINDALDHTGDILSLDRRASYWLSTIMGSFPKLPITKPIPSQAVPGLWFLERPPADEMVFVYKANATVLWEQDSNRLLFRTDGPPHLPAKVFRSSWIIGLLPADEVVILKVENDALVEDVSSIDNSSSGHWLAIRTSTPYPLPEWLVSKTVADVLAGEDSILLSWAKLANYIFKL
jgi:hypothetical protein